MSRALLLLVALLPLSARAWLQDGAVDPLALQAEQALWWGDIQALETLYEQARSRNELNRSNARLPVDSVRAGLASVFGYGDLNAAYFRELELLTARWAEDKPHSVLRQLLYARALYARAWHVRGSGFWQTVPEPARREFARLIAKAEKHIADHAALLMQDTSTHVYLLMIGRSADWSLQKVMAVANDARNRAPRDAMSIDEEVVISLLPRWGGDVERVADYIDHASREAAAGRGPQEREVYAELWASEMDWVDGNLFQETRAQWPRMRQGFERLAKDYPHPYYVNRLAYLACLAQDRAVLRDTLHKLDGSPDLSAWSGGGAAGRQNYEACAAWAGTAP